MSNISKTLLVAAVICVAAANTTTYGQRRSGGGSRNFSSRFQRSGGSSNSRSFSSRSTITRQTKSISSMNRRTVTTPKPSNGIRKNPSSLTGSAFGSKTGSLTNRFTNRRPTLNGKTPSRTPVLSQKKDVKPTNIRTDRKTVGKLPFLSNRNSGKNLNLGKIGGTKAPEKGKNLTNKLPWMPGGFGKGKTHFGNGGNAANQQKISNGSSNKWRELAKHIVRKSLHKNHWCHTRPHVCNWWNVYCKPIAHCHHHQVVVCNWNRVQCGTVALPTQQVQWYLGLKGILLPGKGLGIDAVEPGSPAAQVGLTPGMVLTVCNGIELIDETSMQEAIRISGGILHMTLLSADGSQVLEGTVQMARVAAVSF